MNSLNPDQARTLAIIGMITAPISTIASITIIMLIARRSRSRFSAIQNRLLVGLSLSDIISSVSMTFTSLPMPRGTPNVWLALGNTATCNLQGFIYTFGGLITPSYNAALCIYFLLKIRYDVSEDTMKRKVEPFLHGFPIMNSLFITIYCLTKDLINPQTTVCFITDKPLDCSTSSTVSCERGEGFADDWVVIYAGFYIGVIIPFVVLSTMITLYITVRRQEQKMERRYGRGSLNLTTMDDPAAFPHRDIRQSHYLKMTMYRSLAYSLAWLVPFAGVTFETWHILLTKQRETSFVLQMYVAIFFPLQGFFNFIVYIYPKVLQERQENPDYSICKAFASVFANSY